MLEGLFDADRWSTTFQNMGPFWEGFGVTLQVVVAGLLLSLVLGTLLGVFSTTRSRVLRAISRVYVEFYQNTPLPVQVLFMYMAGPQFLQAITGADQPVRIAPFVLGFLGVGLYHAAYISEVIRTGIEAVPRGQMEAAQSQGFTRAQAYWYIVLPQTFKIILPPLCNQALNLVKNTSVLALVAGGLPYVPFRQLCESVRLPAGIHRLLPYVLHHLLSARHAGAVARAPLKASARREPRRAGARQRRGGLAHGNLQRDQPALHLGRLC